MKSKKGALELSMNTIVVIVIGVVILSLGLMFVRGMFSQLTSQTDIIFGESENALNELASHDDKLTVQSRVNVKQGEQQIFKIWAVNMDNTLGAFSIIVVPSAGQSTVFSEEEVKIEFANPQQNLETGQEIGFVTAVKASKIAPLQSAGYTVNVYKNNVLYASGGFFVEVTK